MNLLARMNDGPAVRSISPRRELGAYEALWLEKGATFKTIAEKFASDPTAVPSDLVPGAVADARAAEVLAALNKAGVSRFGTRLNLTGNYPLKLRDARHPVEMLYFQGAWELVETRCVAIVGSRNPSEDGKLRAANLSRALVERGFTVVSGLATGIDTAAHTAAIKAKGHTIAVIGTPIGTYYPKENQALQRRIAEEHLLISQVPVLEDGKPVGSVQEVTIARVLHDQGDPAKVKVGEIMARPLPTLDVGIHLDEAYRLLMAGHTGVLATAAGKVVDIITRIDLVQYWNRAKK